MKRLCLLLFILAAAAAAEDPPKADPPPNGCLDTVAMRRLYRLGELEEVYFKWRAFSKMVAANQIPVSRDCFVEGNRMMGALGLILDQDTAQAESRFSVVIKLAPRREMWDLSLPMAAQAFWDHYAESRPERTPEQIWEDKWLPPISWTPAPDSLTLKLRNAYHSARLIYALAMDPNKYDIVAKKIAGLKDPAFVLLRADLALRLGEGPTRANRELEGFQSPNSRVISEYDAVGWRTRLGDQIKQQKDPIQPRAKDSIFAAKPPVLKEPRRNRR